MTKQELLAELLQDQPKTPAKAIGSAFAPSNIALIKYWGKRDPELNLPITSSLSIALGMKGAKTSIRPIEASRDTISVNGTLIKAHTPFYQRTQAFVNLLRPHPSIAYAINSEINIPIAAGLASSACGIAALVLAFADLYAWNLPKTLLSIICRIGSGSACRSLWQGLVEWHQGVRADGMDSFAEPLPYIFPNLQLGLLLVSTKEKSVSSRTAMELTTQTSILYQAWPKQVAHDLKLMHHALEQQDFDLLGKTAEHNALVMHATMLAASPAICYSTPETLALIQKIWQLRAEGLPVYFTQDAGPNLKLLFPRDFLNNIRQCFSEVEIIPLNLD